MMEDWPALMMSALLAGAGALEFLLLRKERDSGVRLNFFSIIHPDGEPWPPFGKFDLVVPVLFALAAMAFAADFLGFF
jgi:hypothetical protein